MKKIVSLILLLLVTTIAYSQSHYQDVVYLKNGGIMRGLIIEQVPNKSIKIETADRNVFVYQLEEIEKLAKEPVKRRSGLFANSPGLETGYYGVVEAGYQIGVSNYNRDFNDNRTKILKLNLINGYRLNPFFSVGVGTGLRFFLDDDAALIPVFADFRTNFTDKKISPFLSLSAGYSFDASNEFESTGVGFLLNPTLGVRFKGLNRTAVSVGVGYEMQKIKVPDYYNYYDTRTATLDAISINVGISF